VLSPASWHIISIPPKCRQISTRLHIQEESVLQSHDPEKSNFTQTILIQSKYTKDEKGEVVRDCNSILVRWRHHFSRLLKVHGVNDATQTELHTAEPLLPDPSTFEVENAIEKLKKTEVTKY